MTELQSNRPTETSVQIENIKFHALVAFPCQANQEEKPSHEAFMHKHVFYELFACKQGEIRIKTSDGELLLRAGDLAIIPPTETHVLRYTAKNTEGVIIPFLCKRIGGENNSDLFKRLTPLLNSEIHLLKGCNELIRETERIVSESFSGGSDPLLIALHLFELFLKIADLKTNRDNERRNGRGFISNDIERMMALDALIANRYLQKYSAGDYAKELFISTRQLDRIVTKRYGKSLHQLIADRRMALAEQLLRTTELTVEEIASATGFTSSATLYREFKKRRGITPSAFRNK